MINALTNATFFDGRGIIKNQVLLLENGKIRGFTEKDKIPSECSVTNCDGCNVSPGFIDLQIAGAGGFLFSSFPEPETLRIISAEILKSGTTGFLLVLPTNSFEVYTKAISAVRNLVQPGLLGLHLEGPYISQAKRGAHVSRLIKKAVMKELISLLEDGKGIIKMMTVAPEECNREFIETIRSYGIVVCAGHSNASLQEAQDGFNSGITGVTHLFNAMSSFHHREPGLPGAALLDREVMASIVADGIHVSYDTIRIAKRLMGKRLYLISDAVEENNTGEYRHVRQSDRFVIPDGTLSGSALTMMKAVRNCTLHAEIPLEESIRMATLYPASLMRILFYGMLEKGSPADLTVFDDNFNVKHVYVGGREII